MQRLQQSQSQPQQERQQKQQSDSNTNSIKRKEWLMMIKMLVKMTTKTEMIRWVTSLLRCSTG